MNIINTLDRINTSFSTIKNKVQQENKVNDFGLNVLLETTYLKILNIITGYNLINANLIKQNSAGVDGIDLQNRVFVQITSTATTTKIQHTIDQILDNKLYQDFDRLLFIFLKDKGNLSEKFKEKISKQIEGKFSIDFEKDLYDPDDFYKQLFGKQDLGQIMKVKEILDATLNYIPENKTSGYEFIGISFDDSNLKDTELLVDALLRNGLNVVTQSQKLYANFKDMDHKFFEYLIFSQEGYDLSYITTNIVVLSNVFIKKYINSKVSECRILNSCLENGHRPLSVSFEQYLIRIEDKIFRDPKTLSTNNFGHSAEVDEIIRELRTPKASLNYTFKEIELSLRKIYSSYTLEIVTGETEDSLYCLYNFHMSDNDNELNYLIYSPEFKRTEVIEHYTKNYKKKYNKNLYVLVPKNYDQTTEKRITSLKTVFHGAKDVKYIDEFLFEKSLKQVELIPLLENENFIEPLFKINNDFKRLSDILFWVKNDSQTSVAFIKGAGGSGKTTVCEKIHDEIIYNIDNNIVIFFNASNYITEIGRRDREKNAQFNLFTIFESCRSDIDINIFKSNFNLGNITLIIDGIDEIISTLPNFSLQTFVDDLFYLKEQIGKGKMIINCRDIYITELENNNPEFGVKHKIFSLLMFDMESAKKYFEKRFSSNTLKVNRKVEESIKILNEFYDDVKPDKHMFSPFVLEIIGLIVENDFNYNDIQYEFESNILTKSYNSDLLTYKICEREIAKKDLHGFIPEMDYFIKFLCLVAIEKNGVISDSEFINLLRRVDIELSTHQVKDSLRDNPFFVLNSNNMYTFRYDFYNSSFKLNAIYAKIINSESFSLSDSFIEVLASEFQYNSLIFKGLMYKLDLKKTEQETSKSKKLGYEIITHKVKKLLILLQQEFEHNANTGVKYLCKQAISNLTIFILTLEKSRDNIEVLLELFGLGRGETKELSGLYLINVPDEANLIFDFSDILFSECEIENYSHFLNCRFNEHTYFYETCKISEVKPPVVNTNKMTATKKNFDSKLVTSDNSLFKLLKLKDGGRETGTVTMRTFFRNFHTHTNNRIGLEASLAIVSSQTYCVPVHVIIDALMQYGILKSVVLDTITMNKDFRSKVEKFLDQNLGFVELNKILKEIDIYRQTNLN